MGPQGVGLAGRCILDFIHPDEQDDAKEDLAHVLRCTEDMGSVTRVRFLRLSAIRLALGASRNDLALWKDQERIAYDSHFMAVDLVITWVAEDLLLCFIHAIVDLSKADNNEHTKTPWTNWCGGALMDGRYAAGLRQALATPYLTDPPHSPFPRQSFTQNAKYQAPHSPATTASSTSNSRSSSLVKTDDQGTPPEQSLTLPSGRMGPLPDKVFQVLQNEDSRRILATYPQTGYEPEDFSEVARSVSMTASGGGQPLPRTNCTRRLETTNTIKDRYDGRVKNLQSVYIPHGCVIFACHKVQPGDPDAEEPQDYTQNAFAAQDGYPVESPAYTVDPHRPRALDTSGRVDHRTSYSSYRPSHPSSNYPSHTTPSPLDQSASYGQYNSSWSSAQTYSSSTHPSSSKYTQSMMSHARTALPSYDEYDTSHSFDGTPTRAAYPQSSIGLSAHGSHPHFSSASGREPGNQVTAYSQEPSQWSPGGNVWTHESSSSAAETPSGGIDGVPLPPSLEVITPISATTNHSLEYSSGYASIGPTSAPPTQSYFTTGSGAASHNQSQTLLVSPTVVKRSSDEMLYGSEHSSGSRSISPHHPRSLQRNPVLTGAAYADYRGYDDSEGSKIQPPSPTRDDPNSGIPARPAIPSHREPSGSRVNGNPPPGVTECASCGITNSPEWRKGESGIKNLCNACGLRFARSKQKKEGVQPQRRKKRDKTVPVVKGKKPAKSRRLDDSPSPVEDPGLGTEEAKPYVAALVVPTTGLPDSGYVHDAYRADYHLPPPENRAYFPLTPVSLDGQAQSQYNSYTRTHD